jgi:hypothetical protein
MLLILSADAEEHEIAVAAIELLLLIVAGWINRRQ